MKITYIAKRSLQDGKFLCYDVIADGICFNLFLSDVVLLEEIVSAATVWLALPPNVQRTAQSYTQPLLKDGDTIEVMKGSLDEEVPTEDREVGEPILEPSPEPGEPGKSISVFPEGKPGMQWTAVEMQNYMGVHGIGYSDGDKKGKMLKKITNHWRETK